MKRVYRLEGLDCAHCAARVEAGMLKLDGVTECHVNFLTQKMTVLCEDSKIEAMEKAAKAVVRKADGDVEMIAL